MNRQTSTITDEGPPNPKIIPAKLEELGYASYAEYLASPHWKDLRERFKENHLRCCARCRATKVQLELHHKTYERFGREELEDLEYLCEPCHEAEHFDVPKVKSPSFSVERFHGSRTTFIARIPGAKRGPEVLRVRRRGQNLYRAGADAGWGWPITDQWLLDAYLGEITLGELEVAIEATLEAGNS